MAKIMIITTGLTGMLNASFELANRLKAAGHQIICGSPQNKKEEVEAQGFTFIKLPTIHFEINAFYLSHKNKIKFHFDALFNKAKLERKALSYLNSEHIIKAFDTSEIDLYLVDMELHEYIIPICSLQKNILLVSQWFNLWKSDKIPPLHSIAIPNQSNEKRIKQLWNNQFEQRQASHQKKVRKYAHTDRQSLLQRLANQLNFKNDELLPYHWPSPFIYRSLPTVSMTSEALEFAKSEREQLYYLGPVVFKNRKDVKENKALSLTIQNILAKRKSEQKKIVYCSMTTMKSTDIGIIQKIVDATQFNEDLILIISVGMSNIKEINVKHHKNAHIFNWVPQLEILKHADLSINHGGIHTINECIHFKVPMLIYSGKEHDQNGCAARVHKHGCGKMANMNEATKQGVYKNIMELLTNNNYSLQIDNLHHDYMHKKEEQILETLIEKVLST